ncbi:MAG: hypothetical protein WEB87_01440 [Bacteriovoracaceae bacterium]
MKNRMTYILLILAVCHCAFAQEGELVEDKKWHEGVYGLFNYSYLDLLIPGKWGATVGKEQNQKRSWELEYLKSNLSLPFVLEDLGSMSDRRITFMGRSQLWFESLNIGYGVSHFYFELFLGSDLLDTASGGNTPSADVAQVESLGSYLSIGNRWKFGKKVVFGVDWIAWSQPWIRLKQDSDYFDYDREGADREAVKDALDVIHGFPRITLLKLQLGVLF